MKPKILVSRKISDLAEEKLTKEFDVTLNPKDEPIPESELIKIINDYDGMISTGFDKIGENFFNNLNGKLKIIAQVGVGYDNISVNSALEKKIKVTNTPNVLNEAVAELTILLILAASRRIGEAYNLVRTDNWKNQKPDLTKFMIGNSVTGKTLGIIGMGRIGRMAAKSAKAFGMKIIYYNRNKLSADLEDGAKYYSDLNSMLPNCDFVSIHTPATAETKYILNKDTISLLPKHAVVINTSRGSTIDDDALFRHKDLVKLFDESQINKSELNAQKNDLAYIKLSGGEVGCMVNGAGLAMATMDLIKQAGGEPANFLDVGGTADSERVETAFRIIIKDPNVKAILVNIFGGIVRCDRVARGIVDACKNMKDEISVPIIVRLEGTNSKIAKDIIDSSGLNFYSAVEFKEAADKVQEVLNVA